jgi:hypothetical protein
MRDKKSALALMSLAVCFVVIPVRMLAHHGTNISYDRTSAKTVMGVVSEFWYKNPHPALFVDVTDKDGKVTRWTIEIAPTPYSLAKAGWTKKRAEDALKPGTPVTVSLFPSRAGTPSGLLQSVKNEQGVAILGNNPGELAR